MSYLSLFGGVPNFSQAIISVWFRCPQSTMTAVTANFDPADSYKLFNGIIPLVVIEPKGYVHTYTTLYSPFFMPSDGLVPSFYTASTSFGPTYPTNPSCLGINCDPGYEHPILYINFETDKPADVVNLQSDLVAPPFGYADVTSVVTDQSAAINGTNIFLASSGSGADMWHHLLVSLNFSPVTARGAPFGTGGGTTSDYIDSASQLFVALDDVNYTEFDLSNNYVLGSKDPNAVVPELAIKVAGSPQPSGNIPTYPFAGPVGGVPGYSLDDADIPSNGNPLGSPATAEFVDNIHQIEMAEFQMWIGQTIDTGDVAMRRLFLDFKRDSNGNPVVDSNGIGTLVPVPPSVAETALGKPLLLLHGSSNWIKGLNTGSLGETTDSNGHIVINSAGQFEPTGEIDPYKPDPSLSSSGSSSHPSTSGSPQIKVALNRHLAARPTSSAAPNMNGDLRSALRQGRTQIRSAARPQSGIVRHHPPIPGRRVRDYPPQT